MRTPEEIKDAIKHCADGKCGRCKYRGDKQVCAEEMLRDALAYIQQLEAAKGMNVPSWISVDERLPEPDKDVLLISHGWEPRKLYVGQLHHVEAQNIILGIKSKASDWKIWGWSYLVEPNVTHWMPLPLPPKDEKHAT